ncbi:MAG: RNA methyltransferase [Deltaproteobacteria bacterium]|nr:RNA methyltransferase [Deltaproteobacteria bacterium]
MGACCRVATNFALHDVRLVTPECDWQGPEARLYAKGPAVAVHQSVRAENSLAAAVVGCQAVVGFSRRTGELRRASISTAEIGGLRSRGLTALVFGREDVGLSREELSSCTHVCTFATAEQMPSLNLSHSVAVAVSRVYEEVSGCPVATVPGAVSMEELEALFEHWQNAILDAGISGDGKPERMMLHIRRLLLRASLTKTEFGILRTYLSKTQVALGTKINRP